jgi:hypothetical protein
MPGPAIWRNREVLHATFIALAAIMLCNKAPHRQCHTTLSTHVHRSAEIGCRLWIALQGSFCAVDRGPVITWGPETLAQNWHCQSHPHSLATATTWPGRLSMKQGSTILLWRLSGEGKGIHWAKISLSITYVRFQSFNHVFSQQLFFF